MPPKKATAAAKAGAKRGRGASPSPKPAARAQPEAERGGSASMARSKAVSAVNPEVPIDPKTGVVYHLACTAKDLADRIILVGDPFRVPIVAESFDKNSVTFDGLHREIRIITGKYKGTPVTVLSTGMGTDNCEIVVNEIHVLKEYDIETKQWRKSPPDVRLIRVGTCGSPRPEFKIGTLAVTQHSIGLDNTCQWYNVPKAGSKAAWPASVAALQKVLNGSGFGKLNPCYAAKAHPSVTKELLASGASTCGKRRSTVSGTTASASGFYGNQGRAVGRFTGTLKVPDLVDQLSALTHNGGEKVANIEMETSSICFLSNLLGYRAGAVCAVIATRAGTHRAFATPAEAKSAVSDAIATALNAIVKL